MPAATNALQPVGRRGAARRRTRPAGWLRKLRQQSRFPISRAAERIEVGRCRRTVGVMSSLQDASVPYFTAERDTPVLDFPSPYTIPRPTQSLEFLARIVEARAEGDMVRLSPELMQVVAADDVAASVAELPTGAPVGGRVGLGGPEALGIDAWARRPFAPTGDARTVASDPRAPDFGTVLVGGELTTSDGARIAATELVAWFAPHPQGAAR
jgi:hypothetical protein